MSYKFYGTGGKDLGEEQFREEIWSDPNLDYEVDITDVGKYDGKWYIFSGVGCSCWSGEYEIESGPYESLADLRAHVDAEYRPHEHYSGLVAGWDDFFGRHPDLI